MGNDSRACITLMQVCCDAHSRINHPLHVSASEPSLGLTSCPGYSQENSTATSCSPTTVQLTRRFSPTVTELDEASMAGVGGAIGSGGQGGVQKINMVKHAYAKAVVFCFCYNLSITFKKVVKCTFLDLDLDLSLLIPWEDS